MKKIKNDKMKEDSLYASCVSKYAVLLSNSMVGLDGAMANAENNNRTEQNEKGTERHILVISFGSLVPSYPPSERNKQANKRMQSQTME